MQGSVSRLWPAVKENHVKIFSIPSCLVHQVLLLSPSSLSKIHIDFSRYCQLYFMLFSFFFQARWSVNTWSRYLEGQLCNSCLLSPHQSHRAALYRSVNSRHFWLLTQKEKGPGSMKWLHCFCNLKDCMRLCKSCIFKRWSFLLGLNKEVIQVLQYFLLSIVLILYF